MQNKGPSQPISLASDVYLIKSFSNKCTHFITCTLPVLAFHTISLLSLCCSFRPGVVSSTHDTVIYIYFMVKFSPHTNACFLPPHFLHPCGHVALAFLFLPIPILCKLLIQESNSISTSVLSSPLLVSSGTAFLCLHFLLLMSYNSSGGENKDTFTKLANF